MANSIISPENETMSMFDWLLANGGSIPIEEWQEEVQPLSSSQKKQPKINAAFLSGESISRIHFDKGVLSVDGYQVSNLENFVPEESGNPPWIAMDTPDIPYGISDGRETKLFIDNQWITVTGGNRAEEISNKRYAADTLSIERSAYERCEYLLSKMFQENNTLTRESAEDMFFEKYIKRMERTYQNLNNRIAKGQARRGDKESRDFLDALITAYPTFCKKAISKMMGNGEIVVLYELQYPFASNELVSEPEEDTSRSEKQDSRKLCGAEKAYHLFDFLDVEGYNLLVDLALTDGSADVETLFKQDTIINDRQKYSNMLSALGNMKLLESEEHDGKVTVNMTEKGSQTYELGKIPPYMVGVDLPITILEILHDGSMKNIEQITGMLPMSESHRNIGNTICNLADMGLISIRNERIYSTPDGRAAYESVVQRILKDVKPQNAVYGELASDASKMGIRLTA